MKKISQHILFTVLALLCMTAIQSCSPDKPEKLLVSVNNSVKDIEIKMDVMQNQKTFKITSKTDWTITAPGLTGTDGGWYTISAAGGKVDTEITVDAKANGTGKERTAILTVKGKDNNVTVTLKQAADGENMIVVTPETLTEFAAVNAPTQTFEITTPFAWEITFKDKTVYAESTNPAIDPQWASVDLSKGDGDKTITVTAKNNSTGDPRTGVFTITAAGKSKTVAVKQLTDINHTFDPAFLAFCLDPEKGKVDTNADGSISKEEAEAITIIDCNTNQLGSLKGIENFTKLTELRCNNNQLKELDLKTNTELTELFCQDNQLSALDVSANTKLTELRCDNNQLEVLDVSKNTALKKLYCDNNNLVELDVSANTELTHIWCNNNQLKELDVSANTELAGLLCNNNQLGVLDMSKNPKLTHLFCDNNALLATIDISGSTFETLTHFNYIGIKNGAAVKVWSEFSTKEIPSEWIGLNITWVFNGVFDPDFLAWCLGDNNGNHGRIDANGDGLISVLEAEAVTIIDCNTNQLGSLKGIENFTKLTELRCNNNQLEVLDVSKNTALKKLYCDNNNLIELDVSKNTELTDLWCSNNQLKELDVSANTELTHIWCNNNQLKELDVSANTELAGLLCQDNQLSALDVSANTKLTHLFCDNNALLATIDISGSTFETLTHFNYIGIKNGAAVKVWSEFSTKEIPSEWIGLNITWALNGVFDPDFLAWCLRDRNGDNGRIDANGDGLISVLEAEAVTKINIEAESIGFLKGIENFKALTSLSSKDCDLMGLDISKNTELTELNLYRNYLTSLNVSKNTALTYLNCNRNKLSSLDLSKNVKLKYLFCDSNQLDKLDVSANPELSLLSCATNRLLLLDVSKNLELAALSCTNNYLRTLYLNPGLVELGCFFNELTTLDISKNYRLTKLHCYNNKLKKLDVSANTRLVELICYNNSSLAEINISGSSFEKLSRFNCASIVLNAKIIVWNGFDINSLPVKSTWDYPNDVSWEPAL